MDARSAKLSSGCKDSPTNAFDEALDIYQVRPRKDKRGVDLISDALPFGRLWYGEPNAASNAVWWANRAGRQAD